MDNKYQSALKNIMHMEEFMDDCSIEHSVSIELVRKITMQVLLMQLQLGSSHDE
jgi:hypothetical protein